MSPRIISLYDFSYKDLLVLYVMAIILFLFGSDSFPLIKQQQEFSLFLMLIFLLKSYAKKITIFVP